LWSYLYIKNRTVPADPNLEFGKAVHFAIAQALSDDDYQHDRYFTEHPVSQALVNAMVKSSLDYVHNLGFLCHIEIEKMLPEGNAEDLGFRGILDVLGVDANGDYHVFDWKTSSREYTKHDVLTSQQLTAYAYLLWAVKGIIPKTVRFCVLDKNFGNLTEYTSNRFYSDIVFWKNKLDVVRSAIENDIIVGNPNNCIKKYGRKTEVCYFYEDCWHSEPRLFLVKHNLELPIIGTGRVRTVD